MKRFFIVTSAQDHILSQDKIYNPNLIVDPVYALDFQLIH